MNYQRLKFILTVILLIILFGTCFSFGKSINAQEEDIGQIKKLRILYQGILSDFQGNPIEDGKYNIRFRIYNQYEEGSVLWEEEYVFYNAIFIKDSNLKILLGRNNVIQLDLGQVPFWLSISIGDINETNQIIWQEEMCPRKKITTLSEVLGEEELTPEQWENLSKLIKERLGDETNVVILFDIEQLKNINYSESEDEGISNIDSQLFNIFQDLANFLTEKIDNIEQTLASIVENINVVISKLDNMVSNLANMKSKIDVLYDVLVVEQKLGPAEPSNSWIENESLINISTSNQQITGKAVIPQGMKLTKVMSDLIEEDSLIFVAFSDEEDILWKVSKDVIEKSFSVILENPVEKDLNFQYWVVSKEENQKSEIMNQELEKSLPEENIPEQEVILPSVSSIETATEAVEGIQNP